MIDLLNLQNEGVQYVGHKGYSPSTMCCFVFLDVSNDYVGRYILIICVYRVIFPLSYMKTTSPCLEVTQTQFLKKFYKKKNLALSYVCCLQTLKSKYMFYVFM